MMRSPSEADMLPPLFADDRIQSPAAAGPPRATVAIFVLQGRGGPRAVGSHPGESPRGIVREGSRQLGARFHENGVQAAARSEKLRELPRLDEGHGAGALSVSVRSTDVSSCTSADATPPTPSLTA